MKPILISADGEVSKLTKKYNVGLTSPAENFKLLSKNILELNKNYKSKKKNIN